MNEIPREVLLANCRIRSDKVGGSGTVIYSAKNKEGKYSTFVLTNSHVIENSIKIGKKWNPLLQHDVKADVRGTVEVHFFKYQYQSRAIGSISIDTDIMTYDKDEDLALLKIRDEDSVPSVAKLYPKGEEGKLHLGIPVYTIGAALGEPPIVTKGVLSQFAREIDNREYWICTAPIIYGNSGGATYLEDSGELIGVPARVALAGSMFSASAVTHLGFIVPITRVYKFFDDQLFRFLYDSHFTEEGEESERKKKREEEEKKKQVVEKEKPEGSREDEE